MSPSSTLDSDIFISSLYICTTLLVVQIIRKIIRSYVRSEFIRSAAEEFIASFELCVVCYELGIVYELNGGLGYGTYLFLATIWWTLRWGNATACPYNHCEEWIDGNFDLLRTLVLIVMDIAGGAIFFRFYLKFLWDLGYGEVHVEHLRVSDCNSDIQIEPWVAACIEGSAVCTCQLVAKLLSEVDMKPLSSAILNSFVGTTLVVAAYETSGGYFNPSLATALQYGCSGTTPWEHFYVYWLASLMGTVVANFLWKTQSFKSIFVSFEDEGQLSKIKSD